MVNSHKSSPRRFHYPLELPICEVWESYYRTFRDCLSHLESCLEALPGGFVGLLLAAYQTGCGKSWPSQASLAYTTYRSSWRGMHTVCVSGLGSAWHRQWKIQAHRHPRMIRFQLTQGRWKSSILGRPWPWQTFHWWSYLGRNFSLKWMSASYTNW